MDSSEKRPKNIPDVLLDAGAGLIFGLVFSVALYTIFLQTGLPDSEFPKVLIWLPMVAGGILGLAYGVNEYQKSPTPK